MKNTTLKILTNKDNREIIMKSLYKMGFECDPKYLNHIYAAMDLGSLDISTIKNFDIESVLIEEYITKEQLLKDFPKVTTRTGNQLGE